MTLIVLMYTSDHTSIGVRVWPASSDVTLSRSEFPKRDILDLVWLWKVETQRGV